MTPEKIATLWKACFVNRWHTNEHLAHLHDPLNGHSGRVAVLLRSLWPHAPAEALWACVAHDLPEYKIGDMSAGSKGENQHLANALGTAENMHSVEMGCEINVTGEWGKRLKLCDKLDALLFAQLHRPDLMQRGDWIKSKARVFRMADDCAVNLDVAEIIRRAA